MWGKPCTNAAVVAPLVGAQDGEGAIKHAGISNKGNHKGLPLRFTDKLMIFVTDVSEFGFNKKSQNINTP
ncbi:MAG: hypothetical protein COB30_004110 [Ectothiorhodospiraceae bacterium]|nr:hypothetical protein [Ectothiorhodospiraceae bacterium]